jgi:transcription elongation factor Elf1
MDTKKRLEILGCPKCGAGKDRTTHSYGKYRVYNTNTTLTLRCQTCGHKIKYKYIQGGFTDDAEQFGDTDTRGTANI